MSGHIYRDPAEPSLDRVQGGLGEKICVTTATAIPPKDDGMAPVIIPSRRRTTSTPNLATFAFVVGIVPLGADCI